MAHAKTFVRKHLKNDFIFPKVMFSALISYKSILVRCTSRLRFDVGCVLLRFEGGAVSNGSGPLMIQLSFFLPTMMTDVMMTEVMMAMAMAVAVYEDWYFLNNLNWDMDWDMDGVVDWDLKKHFF